MLGTGITELLLVMVEFQIISHQVQNGLMDQINGILMNQMIMAVVQELRTVEQSDHL